MNDHKFTFKILILAILGSAIVANSIIIFSDSHERHLTSIWILNITGAIASSLAIIAVWRHGTGGLHGRSYFFLMLGIISWFSADLTLMYYYYALGIEEQRLVTVTDGLWFAGYVFLAFHLFTVLRSISSRIKLAIVALISVITFLFVIYNLSSLLSSEYLADLDFTAFIVTVTYPILDFMLIIPSAIILVSLRRDYQHSIPWLLSSLSLLINAIADDGYVNDFVNGNSQGLWIWDLFYVTDFIIMSAALFWYNKFHISNELKKVRIKQ